MTNATYSADLIVRLPDHANGTITFTNESGYFVSGNYEVFPYKQYSFTLNGSGEITATLPTPDNTGTTAVRWRVVLPSRESASIDFAYSASAQYLRELLAAGASTTTPDQLAALLADYWPIAAGSGSVGTLAAALSATATAVVVSVALPAARVGGYLLIGYGLTTAELRRITAVSNTTYTVAALDLDHDSAERVLFLPSPVLTPEFVGHATGDVAAAIEYASAELTQAAGGGDLIVPRAYTVATVIALTAGVRLLGLSPAVSRLDATTEAGIVSQHGVISADDVDDIAVERLTLINNGRRSMLTFHGVNHLRVRDNVITMAANAANTTGVGWFDSDVAPSGTYTDAIVESNVITPNDKAIIFAGENSGPTTLRHGVIAHNWIDGSNGTDVFGAIKLDLHVEDVGVFDNHIDGADIVTHGINVQENTRRVLVSQNVVRDCTIGIICEDGQTGGDVTDVHLIDNQIYGGDYGISINGPGVGTFERLIIGRNILDGCALGGYRENNAPTIDGVAICDNVISNLADGIGIKVTSNNAIIAGNRIGGTSANESINVNGLSGCVITANICGIKNGSDRYIVGDNYLGRNNVFGSDFNDGAFDASQSTVASASTTTIPLTHTTHIVTGTTTIQTLQRTAGQAERQFHGSAVVLISQDGFRLGSAGNIAPATGAGTTYTVPAGTAAFLVYNPGSLTWQHIAATDATTTAHLASTSNPHSVTAAQVGALALTGGTIAGTVDFAGNLLKGNVGKDTSTTQSTAYVLNWQTGAAWRITLSGNVTVTFANTPATAYARAVVHVKQDGTGGRTCAFSGVLWPAGTPPTFSVAAAAEDVVELWTYGGAIYGKIIGQAYA